MIRLRGSVAFRLAVGYGALVVGTIVATVIVLYIGTVGVIDREIDTKLRAVSRQLLASYARGGIPDLRQEIAEFLTDNRDQDTEEFLLLKPDGTSLIGNIAATPGLAPGAARDRPVIRYGRSSISRLQWHPLAEGYTLIVGRDLADLAEIRNLVVVALLIAAAAGSLLAVAGAVVFRRELEARIGTIRRTAQEIEAGDLKRRIPEAAADDEFTRLSHSINLMLDRIQRAMEGARDVSNAIAHDLRTPLGRIRGLLDRSLAPPVSAEARTELTRSAIDAVDDLVRGLDKLLQIAEAESGIRRQSFGPVHLATIVTNIVELYDAEAEAHGSLLIADVACDAVTSGDKDLLASAVANLVDNALKYAGDASMVRVRTAASGDAVSIEVADNGPGIPTGERGKVTERFYRLDRSRAQPGNGLGLAIVSAICALHGGSLSLQDAEPGLLAKIVLPRLHRS
jgi:signal transduction histidine kinase